MEFNFALPGIFEITSELMQLAAPLVANLSTVVLLSGWIFRCISLYGIASRRRIHHPWLSWIPGGSSWILGSIADQYQYVVKGRITGRRKILLPLSILTHLFTLVELAFSLMLFLPLFMPTISWRILPEIPMAVVAAIVWTMVAVLPILTIVQAVMRYIALHDLFVSCDPDTKNIYLILGIILPFLVPFFLFADRNRDNGMPPRIDEFSGDIPNYREENGPEF